MTGGYAVHTSTAFDTTGIVGTWYMGHTAGRVPTDQGSDE
jgi:hypothetical protein